MHPKLCSSLPARELHNCPMSPINHAPACILTAPFNHRHTILNRDWKRITRAHTFLCNTRHSIETMHVSAKELPKWSPKPSPKRYSIVSYSTFIVTILQFSLLRYFEPNVNRFLNRCCHRRRTRNSRIYDSFFGCSTSSIDDTIWCLNLIYNR